MNIARTLKEAEIRLENGYSRSRIVDFVVTHTNNDTQANMVLKRVFKVK